MKLKTIKGFKVKKQDRLNDIVLKMYNGEACVKNLAKLYDTTPRTIQNDIKELSQIYEIISPSRGVYKIENKTPIIEEEIEKTLLKFIIKANYDIFPEFHHLIKKIELKSDLKPTKFFEVNFKVSNLKNNEILITLMQAIEWNYALEFIYKNEKRIIQPLKIINYNTIWYIIGFDLQKNKIKTFKINKIDNLITQTENYLGEKIYKLKKEVENIKTPWINDTKKETIFRVYSPISDIQEEIIKKDEKFVDIKVEYFDEREAFEIAKKYLPYVKIMDKNLKEKIKELLKESIEFI